MDDFATGYLAGQDSGGGGNGNNAGGFWGDGGWIFAIIIFAMIFGWGNGGFGGYGGGGALTRAELYDGFSMQNIDGAVRGVQQGICDATYALNNAITGGFANTNLGMMQGFNGVERSVCDLSHQISDCCCTTQRAIDGVNYNMATQTNALQHTMCNNTRDIIDSQNSGTRAILDFLTQDKIAALTAENQTLKFAASQQAQNAFITANQEAQTAELIRRLGKDCPVPAYWVQPPTPVAVPNYCGGGNSCC